MRENIKIEIHQNDTIINMFVGVMVVFFMVYLAWILTVFNFAAFILFVLLLVPFCIFGEMYLSRPTVISSDGKTLRWKHLFKSYEMNISDITSLSCEPYEVRVRYSTTQRIRLRIEADNDIGEIEFNDIVNAADLLNEKLKGKKSDIPIVGLYEFLKEHGC